MQPEHAAPAAQGLSVMNKFRLALLLPLLACSDDPEGCARNQQISCTTSTGSQGIQSCDANREYSTCTAIGSVLPAMMMSNAPGATGAGGGGSSAVSAPNNGMATPPPVRMPGAGTPAATPPPSAAPPTSGVPSPGAPAASDPQLEAQLENRLVSWEQRTLTGFLVTKNFGLALCDGGLATLQEARETNIETDILTSDFVSVGFWTARRASAADVRVDGRFLSSTDPDRMQGFEQQFALGISGNAVASVDGAPIATFSDVTASCAMFAATLVRDCPQSSSAFCAELRRRGAVPMGGGASAGGGALSCPSLPSPRNACGDCLASSCCDQAEACLAGSPCAALIACTVPCPTLDLVCIQTQCPGAEQGAAAATQLVECSNAACPACAG
jgi:hypothetical protein